MILAVSRLRAIDDAGDAAIAAVLERALPVAGWAGCLGFDAFPDPHDTRQCYVVTRWTDPGSFHDWHREQVSPLRRASDAWLPDGLRLDPDYVRLVALDRSPAEAADALRLAPGEAVAVARYLGRTRFVHVLRLSLDGTVLFANDALRTLCEDSGQDLVGTPVFPHLTEPDARRLRRVLEGEPPPDGSLLLNFCGGAQGDPTTLACHFHVTAEDCLILGDPPYELDRDLQRQLIELNEDLAILARERQRAVAAEQTGRRTAELATRTKDDALAVIAHELRQPISAAAMALAVLDQRPEALDRVRDTVSRQLAHMSRLVNDLLDASNVLHGRILLQKQHVDLRAIAAEGLDELEPVMRERRQRPSLSVPDASVPIAADPLRVRQVLSNLLTNATKFTPGGGAISLSVELEDAFAVVRVRDTGKGIDPAVAGRLFDLFARGSTDTEGLGIGLAVSKRLVELHGGTIEGRSEGAGLGSEFVTRWPLAT